MEKRRKHRTAVTDSSGEETEGPSSLSFEEILRAQNEVGTKAFSKMAAGPRSGRTAGGPSKDQPLEMSAKKPVPTLRKVATAKERVRRDPRFDDLSGDFRPELFQQTYDFLDEMRSKEKEILKKKLVKLRNPDTKQQLKGLLLRMTQQEQAAQQKQRMREKQAEFKREQRERAQEGKRPYYLKKSDQWKLELADKYRELKKGGKVEKFLSKKRKRNSIKDRKRLPSQQ